MLKIVIIDDEYYTRMALEVSTPWNEIGYDLVGGADDGEEGLKLIIDKNPDVALVDINMPKMDGLTLVKKVKEHKLSTQCVMLTGYSEFAYARKALQLGVSNYLLKPVNTNELIQELDKLKRNIVPKHRLLQEEFLSKMSGSKFKVMTTEQQMKVLKKIQLDNINFNCQMRVITVNHINTTQQLEHIEADYSESHIKESLYKIVDDNKGEWIGICWDTDDYTCNLITIDHHSDIKGSELEKNLMKYKYEIDNAGKEKVVICISEQFNDINKLWSINQTNQHILTNKIILDIENPIYISDTKLGIGYEHKGLTDKQRQQLIIYFRKREIDKFKVFLNKMLKEILDKKYPVSVIESMVKQLFSLAYDYAKECRCIDAIDWHDQKSWKIKIKYFINMEQLENWLIDFFSQYMQKLRVTEISESDILVNRIKEYVECNYHQHDCNIQKVVDNFNFNYHYICKLFKTKTDDTLGEYIITTRMENAKVIIKSGERNVEKLADSCGYTDSRYFSKCFKKYHGITPSSYIKRIREQ